MRFFDRVKREEPEYVETCVNLPDQAMLEKSGTVNRQKEVTEFYIISTARIVKIGDKTLYSVDHLIPLTPQPARVWPLTTFRPFSDGKTTLYLCEGFSTLDGQQMFEMTPDGKMTLHLALFKLLSSEKMALIKISAPQTWHANVAAARARLDPSISCVWAPTFEKRPA